MSEIYEQPNQYPQPEKEDNTLAIVSLICACAALLINPFGLVVLVSIITGILALTKKTCKSKGMAVAGLIISGVIIIAEIILAIFSLGATCFC